MDIVNQQGDYRAALATRPHPRRSGPGDGVQHRIERSLNALLRGRTTGHAIELAAQILGLPMRGRYVVIVHRNAGGGAPPVHGKLPPILGGVRVLWVPRAECLVGVAVLGDADLSSVVEALPVSRASQTGVSLVIEGLERLSVARRLAELAVRTITRDGIVCLEHGWTNLLLTACPKVAGELSWRVLAPLLSLDEQTRDLLLDTFTTWSAADGSSHRAASALFCHRNTVLNRLRRLESLTRRSLSTPRDLVELSLAVQAFLLRPPQLAYPNRDRPLRAVSTSL